MYSFPYSFPLWLIIGYWISFPALYSWTFFSFFNLTAPGLSVACGIYFPDQRSNPAPCIGRAVLATETLGKSQTKHFKKQHFECRGGPLMQPGMWGVSKFAKGKAWEVSTFAPGFSPVVTFQVLEVTQGGRPHQRWQSHWAEETKAGLLEQQKMGG